MTVSSQITDDAIAVEKVSVRAALRALRRAFVASQSPAELALLADRMCQNLLLHLAHCNVLGSTCAMGFEIDPRAVEQALPANVQICFPRVSGPGLPLTFRAARRADLMPGYAGIAEPSPDASQIIPDVVLVPLVAVDRHGTRLGQGQGHYDATLAQLRARGRVFVIGIGYACQMVDVLPAQAHDQKLDALATPESFIRF